MFGWVLSKRLPSPFSTSKYLLMMHHRSISWQHSRVSMSQKLGKHVHIGTSSDTDTDSVWLIELTPAGINVSKGSQQLSYR